MTFLNPGALWLLLSLPVFVLFSLWRQKPARVTVPSLRLWKAIPSRVPPLRSLHRPRWNLLLLMQALAAAAIIGAIAAPGVTSAKPVPRKVAVVWDLSAPMAARMEEARAELAKLDPADDIILYESPSLVRHQGLASVRPLDRSGDPRVALDLAAAEAPIVILLSDRDTAWTPPAKVAFHRVLVGGPIENNGIVDANVDNGKLFVRTLKPVTVRVRIDDQPAGMDVPEKAATIEIVIPADAFGADDRVVLRRRASRIDVAVKGTIDPSLRAAFEADPRVHIVDAKAQVVIDLDPSEVTRWIPDPAVTGDDAGIRLVEAGELSGEWDRVLCSVGGKPVAAIRGNRAAIAMRWSKGGWPAQPSFPIFWSRLLEYAARSTGSWIAEGLLDAKASRLGTERRPLDPAALGERPKEPRRTDSTAGAVALAAVFILAAWFLDRS